MKKVPTISVHYLSLKKLYYVKFVNILFPKKLKKKTSFLNQHILGCAHNSKKNNYKPTLKKCSIKFYIRSNVLVI